MYLNQITLVKQLLMRTEALMCFYLKHKLMKMYTAFVFHRRTLDKEKEGMSMAASRNVNNCCYYIDLKKQVHEHGLSCSNISPHIEPFRYHVLHGWFFLCILVTVSCWAFRRHLWLFFTLAIYRSRWYGLLAQPFFFENVKWPVPARSVLRNEVRKEAHT